MLSSVQFNRSVVSDSLRPHFLNLKLHNGRRPLFDSWVEKFPWRRDRLPTPLFLGFPGGSDGKESTCNVEDLGFIPGFGRSFGGGHGNPLQYSCLKNPYGQRNLVGSSPWSHKESDMTEQLSTAQRHTMLNIFSVYIL